MIARIVNQYSLFLLAVPVVAAILVWLLRGPGSRLKQLTAVGLLAVLVIGYFLLQPGQGNRADGPAATTLIDRTDRPVLVEVYSDY